MFINWVRKQCVCWMKWLCASVVCALFSKSGVSQESCVAYISHIKPLFKKTILLTTYPSFPVRPLERSPTIVPVLLQAVSNSIVTVFSGASRRTVGTTKGTMMIMAITVEKRGRREGEGERRKEREKGEGDRRGRRRGRKEKEKEREKENGEKKRERESLVLVKASHYTHTHTRTHTQYTRTHTQYTRHTR